MNFKIGDQWTFSTGKIATVLAILEGGIVKYSWDNSPNWHEMDAATLAIAFEGGNDPWVML